MSHIHNHEQDHNHQHTIVDGLYRIFIISIILNLSFVVVEGIIGWRYNSMGLLSDAGHNLGDTLSLILALFAFIIAKRENNKKFTYGYRKSTILVSLLNSVLLLVAVGAIIVESIDKIKNPNSIDGSVIMWTAGVGILINGFTAWLLMRKQKLDLNVKGAYLHMLMDTLVSVGVVVSGLIISFTDLYIIDSILGLIIALVILISTWSLLKESLLLSLDGVPRSVNLDEIKESILKIDDVKDIHHLHIWAISTTENTATLHLVIEDLNLLEDVQRNVKHLLLHKGISHSTIEIESGNTKCSDLLQS